MGRLTTYTLPQQIEIMKAPEKTERNAGRRRHNYKGVRLTGRSAGYVVDAPVGLTVATDGNIVWRAIHETTGAAILVVKFHKWQRVPFRRWVRLEDELIYTAWVGMLKRCYQTGNDSYPCYGAIGIRVDELSWLPGNRQWEPSGGGVNGSAEERSVAFANFRRHYIEAWKKTYGADSMPHYNVDNLAPENSRSQDEGNYNKTSIPLAWLDHRLVTRVYRTEAAAFEENMDRALAKDRT